MPINDTKQVAQSVFIVRQSAKSLIISIAALQIITLITLIFLIFVFGVLGGSNNILQLPLGKILTFFIVALVLGDLLTSVNLFLSWKYFYYIIKPNEIIFRSGIMNVREKSYQLNQLETVTITQGFFGKLLDYGNMRIFSPLLDSKINVINVPEPNKYRDMIIAFSQKQQQAQVAPQLVPDIHPNIPV